MSLAFSAFTDTILTAFGKRSCLLLLFVTDFNRAHKINLTKRSKDLAFHVEVANSDGRQQFLDIARLIDKRSSKVPLNGY